MLTLSPDAFSKKYPSAPVPAGPAPARTDNYFGRLSQDVSANFNEAAGTLSRLPQTPSLRQEVAAGLNVAKNATGAVLAPINELPGLHQIGQIFGTTGKAISDVLSKNPGYADTFGKLADFLDKNPELGDALGTANNVLQIYGAAQAASGAVNGIRDLSGKVVEAGDKALSSAQDAGSALKDKIQTVVSKKAVSPQLESSATRLQADNIDTVGTYNDYLAQSEKAIKDIKADPAISSVGSDIGDAFKEVVGQRRAVGKVMGSELDKFGSKPVSTRGTFGSFQQELVDNGAKYDALDHTIQTGPESKFSPQDTSILDHYASELQKLGANPTAKALDAFVSRIPNEIKGLKAASGINFQTNAERLINNNLNTLRDTLGSVATPEYNAARAAYKDLSNFVEEGAKHLGEITQSGDFAKDASLAKSAVQSILNNGKKDWLIQLEQLTGKPLLDKAALALQAMKDAGDFRGLSLLQTLSEGSIPLTKHGILAKVADFAIKHGMGKIVGSPADQTRKFLSGLGSASKK